MGGFGAPALRRTLQRRCCSTASIGARPASAPCTARSLTIISLPSVLHPLTRVRAHRLRLAQLSPYALPPNPLSLSERRQAIDRAYGTSRDMKRFLSGWFKFSRFEDIWYDNALEWLAWSMFGASEHAGISFQSSLRMCLSRACRIIVLPVYVLRACVCVLVCVLFVTAASVSESAGTYIEAIPSEYQVRKRSVLAIYA
jgi:hypothetical protein